MSYMATRVPRTAIRDCDAFWKQAKISLWWWVESGDELVFCFENANGASLLTIYCVNQGIPFRLERRGQK